MINEKYVKLLKQDANLTLSHIIALDRVQKQLPITDTEARELKLRKLVDGRKGKYFLSETVASKTDEMAEYVQNKAFNKKYYTDLAYELIKKQNAKGTTKHEIELLLLPKLSKVLNEEQKQNYIRNLLYQMVVNQKIVSEKRRYYLKK